MYTGIHVDILHFNKDTKQSSTTLCLKKTSPTFSAITRESIDGFL